jgi:hypothetical protein
MDMPLSSQSFTATNLISSSHVCNLADDNFNLSLNYNSMQQLAIKTIKTIEDAASKQVNFNSTSWSYIKLAFFYIE